MTAKGIPGLRGTEHIGFTVPDLEEAADFLINVIGCEPYYELGPFAFDDDWMATHLNVRRDAIMTKLRFFRCGNGSNFEVFEYQVDSQNPQPPLNSDIGGHHVALYVDDFDAALAHLKAHNVRVLGAPTVRTSGPSGGQTWVYFLAPWGMQFELVSFPNGKAYEADYARPLWHPARPSE